MKYIERTLQVRAAILSQPDFLEKIRNIFRRHITKDTVCEPIGIGNSRFAYGVGECEITSGCKINLLLKLKKKKSLMKYWQAAQRSRVNDWSELGAFEVYYDFVTGRISIISFRSKAGYERYRSASILGSEVKRAFSLDDNWGGTRVDQGDIGAIPYFQMVIRYNGWFGWLTEGEPPFIEPMYTAEDCGTMDDYTVEGGRIIDLSSTQCLLIDVDRGGCIRFSQRYPSNIGVRLRGEKYFRPENRLDI